LIAFSLIAVWAERGASHASSKNAIIEVFFGIWECNRLLVRLSRDEYQMKLHSN
jgi:hypothetical protein